MDKSRSKIFLRKLLTDMLRIRFCEESFVEPILSGQIRCPVHLYSGQEAIAAGVCAALKPMDHLFGTHRSHGHYLAHGGDLKALVAEIYGKSSGCSKGRGGSMHVGDPAIGMMGAAPIVAGTISLALGAALAFQIKGQKNIVVCFFGDGATGEGVLFECLNFAALKELPILFICENNLYSTHLPIKECRPARPIREIGSPFGIPSFRVDGNDVLKVYGTAKKAADGCRDGKGPAFIECLTYRLRGHVGPDDNIQGCRTDIRPKKEVEHWKKKDPIARYERFLRSRMNFAGPTLDSIRRKIQKEIGQAHEYAHKSDYPNIKELERYVFKK